MPRRKSPSSPPDPATEALLQTLNPHAAGIDVEATESDTPGKAGGLMSGAASKAVGPSYGHL